MSFYSVQRYRNELFIVDQNGFKVEPAISNVYTKSPTGELEFQCDVLNTKELKSENARYHKKHNNHLYYGIPKPEIEYIINNYPDPSQVPTYRTMVIDIENQIKMDGKRFPINQYKAMTPITTLSAKLFGEAGITIGYKDYTGEYKGRFIRVDSEVDVLMYFLDYLAEKDPHLITAWNLDYDIFFIANRIEKLLGKKYLNRLSPNFGVTKLTTDSRDPEKQRIFIAGIQLLDYAALYAKYAYHSGSLKLDYIAEKELGEKKLSYARTLDHLYEEDFNKYVDYNYHDIKLVDKLEQKLEFFRLAQIQGHAMFNNPERVLGTISFIASKMYWQHTANDDMPPLFPIPGKKLAEFEGAYVAVPKRGRYKWTASFDLSSLYPSVDRFWNISPETLTDYFVGCSDNVGDNFEHGVHLGGNVYRLDPDGDKIYPLRMQDILKCNYDVLELPEEHVWGASGYVFHTKFQGFIPKFMKDAYDSRQQIKKTHLALDQKIQLETDPNKKEEMKKRHRDLVLREKSEKLTLVSAYGALGSQYFDWFDVRLAKSITLNGQLAIHSANDSINGAMSTHFGDGDYIIYNDTDSAYVNIQAFVDKVVAKYGKIPDQIIDIVDSFCRLVIDKSIGEGYDKLYQDLGGMEPVLKMDREAISSAGFFLAKKTYFLRVHDNEGTRYAKPKLKKTGINGVDLTSPMVIRESFDEVLNLFLDGEESDMQNYIKTLFRRYKRTPLLEISKMVRANTIPEYEPSVEPPKYYVGKAAYNFNKHIIERQLDVPTIEEGEYFPISMCTNKRYGSDFVPLTADGEILPDYCRPKDIDYNKMFEKSFLMSIKHMLEILKWNHKKREVLF